MCFNLHKFQVQAVTRVGPGPFSAPIPVTVIAGTEPPITLATENGEGAASNGTSTIPQRVIDQSIILPSSIVPLVVIMAAVGVFGLLYYRR